MIHIDPKKLKPEKQIFSLNNIIQNLHCLEVGKYEKRFWDLFKPEIEGAMAYQCGILEHCHKNFSLKSNFM